MKFLKIIVTNRLISAGVSQGLPIKPGYGGQDSIFPRIVKVNPEYWNRDLPKSAIQLINFNSIQNKEYLKRIKEEYLQNNSISYNVKRFEESYDMDDIRKLVQLIGK